MPGKNGTGPLGQGPYLGGAGLGRRAGRGCVQGMRMGRTFGCSRPWGWQWTADSQFEPNAPMEPMQTTNEASALQQQMNSLQTQMKAIQEQLAKLSPPSEDQPSE